MFPRLESLEWLSGRPEVALYDLASSDLRGERDAGVEVVPDPLEGRSDPPAGASLETLIAGAYGVEPERVLVTAGATGARLLAAATAVDRATEESGGGADQSAHGASAPRILVEEPGAESLAKTPRAFGAGVDRFDRGEDCRLDPGRVEAEIDGETCLVALSNRHDPSGRFAERETLAEVAKIVREAGARLYVDETHTPIVGDDSAADAADGAFAGDTAADLEGTVVTGSLAQCYGLGGLRVGWLVGDAQFVARTRSIGHHLPSVADPSRALAMRAFHHADDLAARSRQLLAENAETLAAFVAAREDVTGHVGSESPVAFLDPEGVAGDDLAEAAWEEGVLVVPGRFFGDPERVRVSLGRPPREVSAGLDALGAVLDRV